MSDVSLGEGKEEELMAGSQHLFVCLLIFMAYEVRSSVENMQGRECLRGEQNI